MAGPHGLMENFTNFIQNYHESFNTALLILCTTAGQQVFTFTAFKCPCTHNEAFWYGLSFLAGPAIVLFVAGLMINNMTWYIFHGWYNRKNDNDKNGKKDKSDSCFGQCCSVFNKALVVPGIWIFITFLDGRFYTCMYLTTPCAENVQNSEEYNELLASSQMWCWVSLCVIVIAVSLGICLFRCCDGATYLQYKYVETYREAEELHLAALMKKTSNHQAEIAVAAFMNDSQIRGKKDWDAISLAPPLGVELKDPKTGLQSPWHTHLQKWILDNNQTAVNLQQQHCVNHGEPFRNSEQFQEV